ncbi:MAG: ribokinase [Planctomycetes bacterium]|nr:ribokinase [Planctomycetota bacterium]NOG52903.1 ribokinase [Planctomycetota bacterium]
MPQSTNTVLVIGSANMDLVVHTPAFPAPGQTVIGSAFATFEGGKGANQAVASARYGTDTSLVAAFGADDHAARLLASLAADHVDTAAIIQRDSVPTGIAVITVNDESEGENTIVVAPGANATLSPDDIEARADRITSAGILLMQLEVPLPTVCAAARLAHGAGVPVVLNAAPAPADPNEIAILNNMADLIDLLIVNETECEALAGITADDTVIPDSLDFEDIVLTLGSRGSIARWQGVNLAQPAILVTPVDTTAAGDAFCGVLAAALASGSPFPEALSHASAAGALACTRPGAQPSLPTGTDILQLAGRRQAP